MNHSRRQLPPVVPHKRKGRDETFDFVKPSTVRPPPPPKRAEPEPKPKPLPPKAMAPSRPYKSAGPPPPSFSSRAMAPLRPFKAATPSLMPCSPRPMAPNNPSKAVTLPSVPRATAPIKPTKAMAPSKAVEPPAAHGNMLLAGYLAHEFLTRGTLFGELYDPAQANAPPAYSSASSTNFWTMKQLSHGNVNKGKGKAVEPEPNPSMLETQEVKNQRYSEVSEMLKNGVHIPGIVNPSQLARFLNLQPENK